MPVIEPMDYVSLAKSRYTSQFKDDSVFDALVQTLIEFKMKSQEFYIDFADKVLSIEKAKGKNLDLIGSIVGQSRVLIDYYTKPYFGFYGNPQAEPLDVGLWYSISGGTGGDSRTLSDEEYRRIIKARIIANSTYCSRADFIAIIKLITDNADFKLEVLSHGNILLTLPNEYMQHMVAYFLGRVEDLDSLIPKPLGFRLSVVFGEM